VPIFGGVIAGMGSASTSGIPVPGYNTGLGVTGDISDFQMGELRAFGI
jgi:hypothetical protein